MFSDDEAEEPNTAFHNSIQGQSGPEKGVIAKGVFSLAESLESPKSLDFIESLENGRILHGFPQSGNFSRNSRISKSSRISRKSTFLKRRLFQKTPFSEPEPISSWNVVQLDRS